MRHMAWDIQPTNFTWNVYIDYGNKYDDVTVMQRNCDYFTNSYVRDICPPGMDDEIWADFQNAGLRHFYYLEGPDWVAYILTNRPIPNKETAWTIESIYEDQRSNFIVSIPNDRVIETMRSKTSSMTLSWDIQRAEDRVPVQVEYPITEWWTFYERQDRTNYALVDVPRSLLLGDDPKDKILTWMKEHQEDIDLLDDVMDSVIGDAEVYNSEHSSSGEPDWEYVDITNSDLAVAINRAKGLMPKNTSLKSLGWDLERPTEELEPMTDEEYVERDGLRCPFCRSDNITAQEWNPPYETVDCHDCEERWYDVYKLLGYEV